MSKFNTARKEKLDLYNQFPTAHITKAVKSHFPNVTADLSVLSLIKLQHTLALRTWPWAGSCGGWSLKQGWSRLAGELCQLWSLHSPLPFSPSLTGRSPGSAPEHTCEHRTALWHVITFTYRKKNLPAKTSPVGDMLPAKISPVGRKRSFSLPVWREEKSKMNFAMWTECWMRQTCSWRAIVSELVPWDRSDRVTGDRGTNQTGEVWLRLFRRSE